jgi:hypothetical protein
MKESLDVHTVLCYLFERLFKYVKGHLTCIFFAAAQISES